MQILKLHLTFGSKTESYGVMGNQSMEQHPRGLQLKSHLEKRQLTKKPKYAGPVNKRRKMICRQAAELEVSVSAEIGCMSTKRKPSSKIVPDRQNQKKWRQPQHQNDSSQRVHVTESKEKQKQVGGCNLYTRRGCYIYSNAKGQMPCAMTALCCKETEDASIERA
ncbi:unnamed protein product [Mesocestoides corti]|uniref:Uncharacterized protein n=2 Tax=Mesocestoides corti TaxID=53468 RepID=A0A0R3UJ17_MESCO|nr:unnamed protein product [Mesocestoides corti]